MENPNTKGEREVKEAVVVLQRLFKEYTPEELEDMIFHVFEDANLQAGDLGEEEKLMRYQFHLASRKILRMFTRNPASLQQLFNQ